MSVTCDLEGDASGPLKGFIQLSKSHGRVLGALFALLAVRILAGPICGSDPYCLPES